MLTQRIPLSSLSSSDGYLTVSINLNYCAEDSAKPALQIIPIDELTNAERRVIKLISLPAKNIAHHLNISVHTVKKHIANMLDKTGCVSSRELALWAERKNILTN
ncbi:hypothetical protein GCM10023149_48950 [Mucilaginibacter gynuensis]|uniref:HTH luxR-type domain-containing protein n=1 Tax=Mucilaginibacter gynuensis TaxID=1302236 RepID=A0ABP8HG57_9SPHI